MLYLRESIINASLKLFQAVPHVHLFCSMHVTESIAPVGFPHSEISGSQDICSSRSLSQLVTSFVGS